MPINNYFDDFIQDDMIYLGEYTSTGRRLRSRTRNNNQNSKLSDFYSTSLVKPAPKVIHCPAEKQLYAGLINHGATCYLNSLLQCLFEIFYIFSFTAYPSTFIFLFLSAILFFIDT